MYGREIGGFNFENVRRNSLLLRTGMKMPTAKKTGTTICGVVYKGGVVLGADTRATNDSTICDKNCEKIHYIAPNIYCCGAGTAADTEMTTDLISSQLELLRYATGTDSRVVTAMTMLKRMLFRYQGHVSAALVLGGVDLTGAHLYTIYPHGSTDKLPFVTMGSGSLAAMSAFEAGYKDNMEEDEAVELVVDAISAGIFNDLGSGSNVDITVIRDTGDVDIRRNYRRPNLVGELRERIVRPPGYDIPKGATAVLKETFKRSVVVVEEEPAELGAAAAAKA